MTWFDYAVLAIVGISVLLSIIHGFVRELLALASWIVAFLAAQMCAADAARLLPAAVASESLRLLVAFLAVFLAVLLAMMLLANLLSGLLRRAGLGPVDRILGAVFGLVRGFAIVMVVVLLAGLTALPRQPVWRDAMLSAPLAALADAIKVWLPSNLSQYISYG